MNSVQLVGNLGADPESRATNSGGTVCNLRVATNERRKVGDDWVPHTEWHRVVVFGTTAENCVRFLTKGKKIAVTGVLRTSEWEDKDGNKRYTTEIRAQNVEFLSPKSEDANLPGPAASAGDPDIPF